MCLFIMRANYPGKGGSTEIPGFVRATNGHCDCNAALGSRPATGFDEAHLKKLRDKSWSEGKIARAEANFLKDLKDKYGASTEAEINRWLTLIKDATGRERRKMGLLLHWGDSRDPIVIRKTEKIPVEKLSAEILKNMERDVLYEFLP